MANFRTYPEVKFESEHVTLKDLKDDRNVHNNYLSKKNIPPYPESVLFTISRVCHDTGKSGLHGIITDRGFQIPYDLHDSSNFLWWRLLVTEGDIAIADRRFLRWSFEDEEPNQPFYLEKFTTSPAFQSASRYGNFRFTFPLRKLLYEYSTQFCSHSAPTLRVLCTELYRKEILYSVLVHPPHMHQYDHYRRLPYGTEGVCGYRQGRMSWLCQSPSDWCHYRLVEDYDNGQMHAMQLRGGEFYVWDNVAVAFHMEPGWMLSIDRKELFNNVSVCDMIRPYLLREPDIPLSVHQAEEILADLKERYGQWQ